MQFPSLYSRTHTHLQRKRTWLEIIEPERISDFATTLYYSASADHQFSNGFAHMPFSYTLYHPEQLDIQVEYWSYPPYAYKVYAKLDPNLSGQVTINKMYYKAHTVQKINEWAVRFRDVKTNWTRVWH